MEGEYFYGAVLGEPKATTTWNSSENGEEEQSPLFKLVLKQILLGQKAPVNEYHVVEVKTTSANGPVKIPIAVLKAGEVRTSVVNLEFPEAPVTFTLIEGSGPVYIHGNIISTYMEQVEENEGDECMESVEEEQQEEDNKKRKGDENGSKAANGSSNSQKSNKKQKTG